MSSSLNRTPSSRAQQQEAQQQDTNAAAAELSKLSSRIFEARAHVKRRILGETVPEEVIDALDTVTPKLTQLLRACVVDGESNSVVINGARGTGKSMFMRRAVIRVNQEEAVQQKGYTIVYLHGGLHADDAVAFREIARQISLNIDARVHSPTSGTSPLAVPPFTYDSDFSRSVSRAETADALISALKSGNSAETKSVVIVLDEFDLFAHGKQSMLYTLFDMVQSGNTPLLVVGLTCRLDAVTLLEKRVLSRFSNRQLYTYQPSTFEQYMQAFVNALSLPEDFPTSTYATHWNQHIVGLSQQDAVRRELQLHFGLNSNIRDLYLLLTEPVCRLSPETPYLTPAMLFDARVTQEQDSKVVLLLGSSILEMCILIAAFHVSKLMFPDSFNFEMVFDYYKSFCLDPNNKNVDFYSKPIAQKAFEHLVSLEIIRPVSESAHRMETSTYQSVRVLIERSQLDELLDKYPALPTHIKLWGKS